MTDAAALLADLPDRIGALATRWAAIAPEPAGAGRGERHLALRRAAGHRRRRAGVADGQRRAARRPGDDRRQIAARRWRCCSARPASMPWPLIVNARLSDREIDQIRDLSGARRRSTPSARSRPRPRPCGAPRRRDGDRRSARPHRARAARRGGGAGARGDERRRSGRDRDLHLRHHRHAEGGDADPSQPTVRRQSLRAAARSKPAGRSMACCRRPTRWG